MEKKPNKLPFLRSRDDFSPQFKAWFGSITRAINNIKFHNVLVGLQGGSESERYHLTQSDYDESVDFFDGGTTTRTQLDDHISSTSNPHSVTASQVGNTTAQWNANQLQGNNVENAAPNDDDILQWSTANSQWEPVAFSAGIGGSGTLNNIPLWTPDGSTLGDSFLSQSGGTVVNCSQDFNISTNKSYQINSVDVLDVSGTSNVYVGAANKASHNRNTIIGSNSGTTTATNGQHVLIGDGIGASMTAASGANTVIGSGAGAAITSGTSNSIIGAGAGSSLTTGTNNIIIGANTGASITTASFLIAIGPSAMASNVSGAGVVAIGRLAATSSTANYNVAIGESSLSGATTSPNNVGMGYQAGFGTSTGTGFNTCIGHGAGPGVTSTSNYGVHLGALAGYRVTGGAGNIFIGGWTGYGAASYSISRTIIIGNDCMRTTTPSGDRLYIDVTSGVGAATLIYGEFNNRNLDINGRLATPKKTITLGVGVTTFACDATNVMEVTGDGGGNTIATITGGRDGQSLILIFTDANVTITDDNTHASNSIDLSAAFTSADDTVLHLVNDGTSWYEVSRSVN